MEFNYIQMSQDEFIEYVGSEDFSNEDGIQPKELVWSYMPEFQLSDIKIPYFKNPDAWIEWINNEQEMFNKEMDYDRYKGIEENWILNPTQEPIIMIQLKDGTHDIVDGWHRTGLAFRNNLKEVPAIYGTARQ